MIKFINSTILYLLTLPLLLFLLHASLSHLNRPQMEPIFEYMETDEPNFKAGSNVVEEDAQIPQRQRAVLDLLETMYPSATLPTLEIDELWRWNSTIGWSDCAKIECSMRPSCTFQQVDCCAYHGLYLTRVLHSIILELKNPEEPSFPLATLFGTALGAYRNAAMLPHSPDVDFGLPYTWFKSTESMNKFAKRLYEYGFYVFFERPWRVCAHPNMPDEDFMKSWNRRGSYDRLNNKSSLMGYADIYEMRKSCEYGFFSGNGNCSRVWVVDDNSAWFLEFEGVRSAAVSSFPVVLPDDWEQFMTRLYGFEEWATPSDFHAPRKGVLKPIKPQKSKPQKLKPKKTKPQENKPPNKTFSY
jgi:hypothetical protein